MIERMVSASFTWLVTAVVAACSMASVTVRAYPNQLNQTAFANDSLAVGPYIYAEYLEYGALSRYSSNAVNQTELELLSRLRRALSLRGQCEDPDSAREMCHSFEDADDFGKCMERCTSFEMFLSRFSVLFLMTVKFKL